jgi:hypothetical protein
MVLSKIRRKMAQFEQITGNIIATDVWLGPKEVKELEGDFAAMGEDLRIDPSKTTGLMVGLLNVNFLVQDGLMVGLSFCEERP